MIKRSILDYQDYFSELTIDEKNYLFEQLDPIAETVNRRYYEIYQDTGETPNMKAIIEEQKDKIFQALDECELTSDYFQEALKYIMNRRKEVRKSMKKKSQSLQVETDDVVMIHATHPSEHPNEKYKFSGVVSIKNIRTGDKVEFPYYANSEVDAPHIDLPLGSNIANLPITGGTMYEVMQNVAQTAFKHLEGNWRNLKMAQAEKAADMEKEVPVEVKKVPDVPEALDDLPKEEEEISSEGSEKQVERATEVRESVEMMKEDVANLLKAMYKITLSDNDLKELCQKILSVVTTFVSDETVDRVKDISKEILLTEQELIKEES